MAQCGAHFGDHGAMTSGCDLVLVSGRCNAHESALYRSAHQNTYSRSAMSTVLQAPAATRSRTYQIRTYGCQMNVHDSERLAGLLEQAGYQRSSTDVDADVILINTCSVREHAEEKLYTRLGELRVMNDETGRRPVVAVAGCVAQQEGDTLLRKTNGRMIDV